MSKLKKVNENHFGVGEDLTLAAEETQSRIKHLLKQLEGSDSSHEELLAMKDTMDFLMGSYFEQHLDLDSEMNSLLDDLRKGLVTNEELESMLRVDQSRSGLVSRMAGSLKLQLEALFSQFGGLLEGIYKGGPFPTDQVNTLFSDMNFVLDSVDFISKVVTTPAKQLNATIDQVETDLRTQVEIVLSRSHSFNKMSPHIRMKLNDPHQEVGRGEVPNTASPTSTDASVDSKHHLRLPHFEGIAAAAEAPSTKKSKKKVRAKPPPPDLSAASPDLPGLPLSTGDSYHKEPRIIRVDNSTQTDLIERDVSPTNGKKGGGGGKAAGKVKAVKASAPSLDKEESTDKLGVSSSKSSTAAAAPLSTKASKGKKSSVTKTSEAPSAGPSKLASFLAAADALAFRASAEPDKLPQASAKKESLSVPRASESVPLSSTKTETSLAGTKPRWVEIAEDSLEDLTVRVTPPESPPLLSRKAFESVRGNNSVKAGLLSNSSSPAPGPLTDVSMKPESAMAPPARAESGLDLISRQVSEVLKPEDSEDSPKTKPQSSAVIRVSVSKPSSRQTDILRRLSDNKASRVTSAVPSADSGDPVMSARDEITAVGVSYSSSPAGTSRPSSRPLSSTLPRSRGTMKVDLTNIPNLVLDQGEVSPKAEASPKVAQPLQLQKLVSPVAGIIQRDGNVTLVDSYEFSSLPVEHQTHYISRQQQAGEVVSMDEYRQIVVNIVDGKEVITPPNMSVDPVTVAPTSHLIVMPIEQFNTLKDYTLKEYLSSSRGNSSRGGNTSRSRSRPGTGGSPSKGRISVLQFPTMEESEGDDSSTGAGTRRPDTVQRDLGVTLANLTDAVTSEQLSPKARKTKIFEMSQRIIKNTLKRDLLTIYAPSKRDRLTDMDDFTEYLYHFVSPSAALERKAGLSLLLGHNLDLDNQPPDSSRQIRVTATKNEGKTLPLLRQGQGPADLLSGSSTDHFPSELSRFERRELADMHEASSFFPRLSLVTSTSIIDS